MHCEVNGTGYDWQIEGDANRFINCAGAATTPGSRVMGDYNVIDGGDWQSMDVRSGATRNVFDGIKEITAFIDSGTDTTILNAGGGIIPADKIPTLVVDAGNTAPVNAAWYVGQQGSITPARNGVAAVGTSLKWTHHDHVHPAGPASILTKSANYMVAAADRGALIIGTSTFTLSFDAAATLGGNFIFHFRNNGAA